MLGIRRLCDRGARPKVTQAVGSPAASLSAADPAPAMNLLLLHQNFPGQFLHLAPELARQGHRVVALGMRDAVPPMPGVRYLRHQPRPTPPRAEAEAGQPVAALLDGLASKLHRAESAARAMEQLRREGFVPDVVLAHSGWGEALWVKTVFPEASLKVYAEYYYGAPGGDIGFDPEFSSDARIAQARAAVNNLHLMQAMVTCDAALSPTRFQRDQHPALFLPKMTVSHDGIDTERFRPDPQAWVQLGRAGLRLAAGDEVVTFVARHLEPYRGYHRFMRALPTLLRLRPKARVIIVGGDGVSYGAPPPPGQTWKQRFLEEVREGLDLTRVHFVGKVPHETLTRLLQVSAVHVYLTYPFVLSWSMMEAMSIGCALVASDTAPVRELIEPGEHGWLVDFFDAEALAQTVAQALDDPAARRAMGRRARERIVAQYDLRRHGLPAGVRFVTQG